MAMPGGVSVGQSSMSGVSLRTSVGDEDINPAEVFDNLGDGLLDSIGV